MASGILLTYNCIFCGCDNTLRRHVHQEGPEWMVAFIHSLTGYHDRFSDEI
eukprot:CAMPEP_0185264506 /NCGR_PEP_ID=MMETSP1359-20130426/23507_1 /TAXON_ID=552665 /ORGANISM="Bigelowiella longifila, Strain CCMP242" /LENGTH=50 /DNA_ID=CAMNT_0027853153 /DNA_START=26 /DNA_END=175 /DNA_ORIENTATION=+